MVIFHAIEHKTKGSELPWSFRNCKSRVISAEVKACTQERVAGKQNGGDQSTAVLSNTPVCLT